MGARQLRVGMRMSRVVCAMVQAAARGLSCVAVDLAMFEPAVFETHARVVLLVATHGVGGPTKSAQRFHKWMVRRTAGLVLTGTHGYSRGIPGTHGCAVDTGLHPHHVTVSRNRPHHSTTAITQVSKSAERTRRVGRYYPSRPVYSSWARARSRGIPTRFVPLERRGLSHLLPQCDATGQPLCNTSVAVFGLGNSRCGGSPCCRRHAKQASRSGGRTSSAPAAEV
jgi:hypothetical protein